MLIAHRGKVNNFIKENTLDAFKEAINDPKYVGFELDVRETKDHEFICAHDFLSHNKIIKNTNLDELVTLGFTSLKDVLKLETDKIILVEIKDFNINISKLSTLLNKAKRSIYVMSFNNKVMHQIKPYAKNFKCGILNYIFKQ